MVDELRQAALDGDAKKLALVREIIKRIKQSQLEHQRIADNDMVLSVLNELQRDRNHRLDLNTIDAYIKECSKP